MDEYVRRVSSFYITVMCIMKEALHFSIPLKNTLDIVTVLR